VKVKRFAINMKRDKYWKDLTDRMQRVLEQSILYFFVIFCLLKSVTAIFFVKNIQYCAILGTVIIKSVVNVFCKKL
jgi:hypothetical protein